MKFILNQINISLTRYKPISDLKTQKRYPFTTNTLKAITEHCSVSHGHLKKKLHESLSHKKECDILSIWNNRVAGW